MSSGESLNTTESFDHVVLFDARSDASSGLYARYQGDIDESQGARLWKGNNYSTARASGIQEWLAILTRSAGHSRVKKILIHAQFAYSQTGASQLIAREIASENRDRNAGCAFRLRIFMTASIRGYVINKYLLSVCTRVVKLEIRKCIKLNQVWSLVILLDQGRGIWSIRSLLK